MKRRSRIIGCLLSTLLVAAGCTKTSDTAVSAAPGTAQTAPARSGSIAPAPASASTAPANMVATNASAAAPSASPAGAAASASAAPAAAVESASPEVLRKRAQIEWALKQDEIKNDANGQWATQATGSSAYNDAKGNAPYAAAQATGPATIEGYGNNASAWVPKTPDAGIEWLDLQYAKPVHATSVRVRENYGSGAVIKIELFDEKGAAHTVWSGTDPTKDLNYLVAEFPKTDFKTGRVKLTLATNIVSGANEIDAVQLVGTDQ